MHSTANTTQMDCDYLVGESLHFAIAGVGQPDAAVTFYKVDWEADYYASFGLLHGCVIVKPGPLTRDRRIESGDLDVFDMAFVSPRNGKVYSSWSACADAL